MIGFLCIIFSWFFPVFPESIEQYIEDQAFSMPYQSAPPPPPVSKINRQRKGTVRKRDNLRTRERGRGGGGAKAYEESLQGVNAKHDRYRHYCIKPSDFCI